MRRGTAFARTSSRASHLVDPHVDEDIDPVHGAEFAFPVIALDPRLGGTEEGRDGSPDRPQLLGDAHVGHPHPLFLLLCRGGVQRILVILVKHGVVDIHGAPSVLQPVHRDRGRGTLILGGPYIRAHPEKFMLQGLLDHVITGDGLDLDVNAYLPEVIHGDLVVAQVEELVVLIDGLEAYAVFTARIAGLVQQLLGCFGVKAIVLLDFLGPLLVRHEIHEHRFANPADRARIAPPLHVVLGNGLEVDGHVDGLAHADVVEWRFLVVPIDSGFRTVGKGVEHQVGIGLL